MNSFLLNMLTAPGGSSCLSFFTASHESPRFSPQVQHFILSVRPCQFSRWERELNWYFRNNDGYLHPPPHVEQSTVLEESWLLQYLWEKLFFFTPLLSVILLTSHYLTNLDGTCQEMEVSAEGAAVNCFFLTHFGRPSPATVNFPACSSLIGGVSGERCRQKRNFQLGCCTGAKRGETDCFLKCKHLQNEPEPLRKLFDDF